jgi:lysine 6-dehydrogenase
VEVVAQLISGDHVTLSIISKFDKKTGMTGMAQLTSFLAAWTARRVADDPALCKPGLTLSHEFYDNNSTRELLTAYQQHVKCSVRS